MHRADKPHPVTGMRSFEIDWNRDPTGDDSRVSPDEQQSIPAAWADLMSIARSELQDFEPIEDFLNYLDQNLPSTWSKQDPAVPLFLERLNQLEDLAWAVELKRQSPE